MGRGETVQQDAASEVYEEVGLAVEVGRPLSIGVGDYGELSILFECRAIGGPTLRLSDEVDRAEFFPADALPPMPEYARRWLLSGLAASNCTPPGRHRDDVSGDGTSSVAPWRG